MGDYFSSLSLWVFLCKMGLYCLHEGWSEDWRLAHQVGVWGYGCRTSLVAQMVKRLPTMQETRVQSLGQEDPWRRIWQPTPVLLPGKSHGWRCLVGCSPWGREESDTQSVKTEQLHFHFSLFTFLHWRRKWQPTPVFLPGESQGQGSLVGCHLWGHTESDTTEVT